MASADQIKQEALPYSPLASLVRLLHGEEAFTGDLNVDTRHLRAFLKIAETGSISRAADLLGLTQPSLSQQVLRLEDEVGCKLFERKARGVTTTEAGRLFEKHARQILDGAEHALEDMHQFKAEARARVTLAMPYSVSKLLGAALTEAVLEKTPRVSLRLMEAFSSPIRLMIESGVVDFGLLYDVEALDHLVVKQLAREELYLIGPPGRWPGIESGEALLARELATIPLILPQPGHGLRQCLDRAAQRLGFRLHVASEIDSLQHIAGLVADGRGQSILPLSAVEREIEAGAISAMRIDDVAFGRTLCLVKRPDVATGDAVRMVEELTISVLARMIAKRRWIAAPAADLR